MIYSETVWCRIISSYFDVVQFHVIDAMHNLLLGMAKNMMRIWCENGIIASCDLQSIQYTINSIVVPGDVGRIPSNVASSCYGFTADQWRNWTCIFSPAVLKHTYNFSRASTLLASLC